MLWNVVRFIVVVTRLVITFDCFNKKAVRVFLEPTVRAELMEQIPHIAIFCQDNRPSIPFAFSKYLLPIVVRYLADQNNLVSVFVF